MTKRSDPLLEILKNYSIGEIVDIKAIEEGVSNKNYFIATNKGKYVLRNATKNQKNQIQNMVPFLKIAKDANFPCPSIIQTISKTTYIKDGKKLFLLMSCEPGIQATLENINKERIKSFAETLALLHNTTWVPRGKVRAMNYEYILKSFGKYLLRVKESKKVFTGENSFLKNMISEYNALKEYLPKIIPNLPVGIIHNDPTPWNTLYIGNKVSSIVDFEAVGRGVYLFDIARAINLWCFHDEKLDKNRVKIFINTYSKTRPLTVEEQAYLPTMLRFIAFRHSVYFMRFFINNKHDNPSKAIDYECLAYYRKIGDEKLKKLLFG